MQFSAQPLEAEVPVPWTVAVGGNGHFFQAVSAPEGINWDNAEAWAVARGGHLATIHSAAENDFVFKLVDDPRFWKQNRGISGGRAWESFLGPWLGGIKVPDSKHPGGRLALAHRRSGLHLHQLSSLETGQSRREGHADELSGFGAGPPPAALAGC